MPVASRKQCKNPKGFSQKASCKAQGLIPRTSRKNYGKFIVSSKYKKRSDKKIRKQSRKMSHKKNRKF